MSSISDNSAPASFPRGWRCWLRAPSSWRSWDATIITPAIPLIASSFGIDAVDVNVAISAYLVTVAGLIPATVDGRPVRGRRVFIAAIAVFTLASVGCAASVSLPMWWPCGSYKESVAP